MRRQTSPTAELFARALRTLVLGVFAVFVCTFIFTEVATEKAMAAVSSYLNFQARLETSAGAIAADGDYNVEFKIYNASTSSGSSQGSCSGDAACLWVETRTSTSKVHVSNGYLTVNLGSVNAFSSSMNWNQQLWISMNIGGTGSSPTWDGEMSPRLQLTATPYSFQAGAFGNGSYSAVFNASGNLEFQQASTIDALSAATGTQLTIQGGTATSGTNVGGTLLLQGGAGASTGASGSVVVKSNGNNSTTAFQVQNASGINVLTVDTTDKFVGIGTTSTPRTTLDVVSSDTTYGGAIIENTDTANSTNSFAPLFVQHDSNTNGSSAGIGFRLKNSSGTALTYGYIGGTIQSNVASSEAGQLIFQAANGSGTLSPSMILNSTGVAISQGINFNPQYTLQVVGNTDGSAVGPLVVQSTNSGSSIGTALTLDSSPATGGHKWSFLSTGPAAAAGAGSFSFFDGTANAYRLSIGATGNVGVGITAPTNLFQVGPLDASGSATRTNSSATLVGSGTGWTSAQVGDIVVFSGGTTNTVSSVTDSTHLTMGTTYIGTTDSSPVSFTMYKPAFNVTTSGNTYVQNTSNAAFQVQNASGASIFNVDTSNTAITINAGQNGATGAFSTDANALPSGANAYYQTAVTTANGYIYVLGGADGSLNATSTVYYAKANADGSTGTWTTNVNSLPSARRAGSAVVNNGYIYYLGGNGGSQAQDVYYAKLNPDGSTGVWASTTVIPQTSGLNVGPITAAVANGYLYSVGNYNSPYTSVYYAKFNADGTVGAWSSGTSLPTGKMNETLVVGNGYIYAIGGLNNSTGATVSSTYYAPLNTDGSIGSWTSTTAMPNPRNGSAYGVANGYVYVVAGYDNSTVTATTYYAKLNTNGAIGTWSCEGASGPCNTTPVNANAIPVAADGISGTIVNGYLYAIGGGVYSSASYNTVYYAPVAKVQIAGDLDLVGLTSGQLSGPSQTGGTIYAGNIFSNGNLSVQGNTRFWNGLSLNGVLSGNGDVLFKSATNAATAFVVQNSSSNQVLGVDTNGSQVLFGNAGSLAGKLTLYSGTTSNNNTVTLTVGNTSASYTLTLPAAVGSNGQCLKAADNVGTLNWGYCVSGTTTVTLVPEFAGSTFSQYGADGATSGTNTGFMQSDHYVSGTSKHNYYQWSTDQASAQDYHIITEYQLPSTFSAFAAGSWKLWTYADSLTSTNLQFTIYSNNNTACYSSLQSIKPSSATTWQQISIADPGNGCTFAANDVITIDIKMTAVQPSTNYVKVGELQFGYN